MKPKDKLKMKWKTFFSGGIYDIITDEKTPRYIARTFTGLAGEIMANHICLLHNAYLERNP